MKSLAWNSCYDKETLHVSHQRQYKILFKVKKTKVQWSKDCSNLRKISLRPQKVGEWPKKLLKSNSPLSLSSGCCLFQRWFRSSTKRTHTQGGSLQRGKIYESSLSEPSWSWQEQAGNAAVMTQAAKVLLRCVERGSSPSCTA